MRDERARMMLAITSMPLRLHRSAMMPEGVSIRSMASEKAEAMIPMVVGVKPIVPMNSFSVLYQKTQLCRKAPA